MVDASSSDAPVTVTVMVTGPGRVTSTPAGINCGGGSLACSAQFTGSSVVLATDDATTVRWGGACVGNGECALATGADRTVTAATFAPLRRTFDGDDHGNDACYAIAVGPDDSVVIAGQVYNVAQGDDAWARRYTASGAVVWTYQLSTPSEGHDRAYGVVVLPDGNAVVAGTWYSGSNTQFNSFLLDFTPAGGLTWARLSETIGFDAYYGIARNAGGGLIVAGALADGSGRSHAWIRALTASGTPGPWELTRPGERRASAVAVDSTGNVVVVGDDITKYSPLGALRWSIPFASSSGDGVTHVAIAPDDSIAIVGYLGTSSSIRLYNADGTPRWDVTAADAITWSGTAVDAAGNVVVTGGLGADLVARKYTPAGTLVWQRIVKDARGQAVAIDSRGDVLVCGSAMVAGKTDGLVLTFVQ